MSHPVVAIDSDTVIVYTCAVEYGRLGERLTGEARRREPREPMEPDETILSIEELAEQARVSPRTVRYYISEGLLPGPGARGKLASYGGDHLTRLRLIRRLLDQGMPLAKVKGVLGSLAPQEVRELLREEDERAAKLDRAQASPSPREYVSELLRQAQTRRQAPGLAPYVSPGVAPKQATPPSGGASSAPTAWERIEIAPGVELSVRADVAARFRTILDRFIALLRAELDERA